MSHERTFSDTDPFLADIRRICLDLPATTEVEAWGRPTFRVAKKMFAVFVYMDDTYRLVFKPDPAERPALVADPRVTLPKYYGPSGWLAVDLDNTTDWNEIVELVETSYLLTAPKPRRAAGADRL